MDVAFLKNKAQTDKPFLVGDASHGSNGLLGVFIWADCIQIDSYGPGVMTQRSGIKVNHTTTEPKNERR